jgi:hypothetical protein
MRAIFSIVGLLMVVFVVGMLAKKQLHSVAAIHPMPQDSSTIVLPTVPGATVQQQSLQIQQQVKKSVEDTLQQTRAVPDDK